MKKAGIKPVLLLTAAFSLVAMTVYELAKQFLLPDVSIWESHAITIFVVSGFITGMVYFVIRDRQERLTSVVKTMQQRAELERRLRTAEAKKDMVLNSISEMVVYQDTDLRILWANRSATGVVNTSLDEVVGMTCRELFGHPAERCATCPMHLALQNRQTEEGEVRLENGKTLLVRANVVRDDDEIVKGVVTVASDITAMKTAVEERRQIEFKMLQAQKLESLGVLAGGIAHDFNNLLVGILGNADLALSELERQVSPRQTIENIKDASLRAADLTNQMLAFSGKGSFIVKPLRLNDLILNMNRLLKTALSPKTKIHFELGDNICQVEGDEMQLRQVVMNLVVNAAEAITKFPGEIRLRTSQVYITQDDLEESYVGEPMFPGEYLVLEVSDTGCGMDEETREKLFDPFFTTKFPGRGLGLAAVLGIVRGHGGAIFVRSKPGAGSTFRILLPFHAPAEAFRPAQKQSA